jgi:hypothetical protein
VFGSHVERRRPIPQRSRFRPSQPDGKSTHRGPPPEEWTVRRCRLPCRAHVGAQPARRLRPAEVVVFEVTGTRQQLPVSVPPRAKLPHPKESRSQHPVDQFQGPPNRSVTGLVGQAPISSYALEGRAPRHSAKHRSTHRTLTNLPGVSQLSQVALEGVLARPDRWSPLLRRDVAATRWLPKTSSEPRVQR